MKSRRRLRNALEVERGFKLEQVGRVSAFSTVYIAMSTVLLGFFYVALVHPGVVGSQSWPGPSEIATVWKELPDLRRALGLWLVGMVGLSALFSTALGLHFGHLVAGPIYRFKLELHRIEAGESIRPIRLRQGDAFQDVAEAMNRSLRRFESDERRLLVQEEELAALRELQENLRDRVDAFAADPARETDPRVLEELLGSLRAEFQKAEESSARARATGTLS